MKLKFTVEFDCDEAEPYELERAIKENLRLVFRDNNDPLYLGGVVVHYVPTNELGARSNTKKVVMTKDSVIAMAKVAGVKMDWIYKFHDIPDFLIRFAELVATSEHKRSLNDTSELAR